MHIVNRRERQAGRADSPGPLSVLLRQSAYWQIGSPSSVEPPPSVIWQVFAVDMLVADAAQPVFVTLFSATVMPLDAL